MAVPHSSKASYSELFALVTGASSGIGASFAKTLAARGRNLVLVARSQDKLDRLKTELSSKPGLRIEVIVQDLSVPHSASQLASLLSERGIEIDLLINNAGFGAQGEFWELPLERQTEMLRLNIGALTELTYFLLPGMLARKSGGIINVSSTASIQPVPYLATYAATKAYVTSFSMALAEEVRSYGIKVLALCPGSTDTGFFAAGQFTEGNFGSKQSPDEVAEAGLRALDAGKTMTVTRIDNRIMVFVERFVSRRLVARLAGRVAKPRGTPMGQ